MSGRQDNLQREKKARNRAFLPTTCGLLLCGGPLVCVHSLEQLELVARPNCGDGCEKLVMSSLIWLRRKFRFLVPVGKRLESGTSFSGPEP
ncbi:hypothetical protein R1flu_005072 [Riccia fluitans]|uniref:Secreted protein n=1 Tax=Riccia fluitans TaxID=41844 RepID=A0ABD1YSQ0_9MARC